MGDRGEDIEQMTTGRTRTRVAAFRTEPVRALPGEPPGLPGHYVLVEEDNGHWEYHFISSFSSMKGAVTEKLECN